MDAEVTRPITSTGHNGVLAQRAFERERHYVIMGNIRRRPAAEHLGDAAHTSEIGDEPVEEREIEEADVLSRAAQMDYVIKLADSVPYIRNHIAHGGRVLHPGSAATLRVVAEAITSSLNCLNRGRLNRGIEFGSLCDG